MGSIWHLGRSWIGIAVSKPGGHHMKKLLLRLSSQSMKETVFAGRERALVYTFEGEALRHR